MLGCLVPRIAVAKIFIDDGFVQDDTKTGAPNWPKANLKFPIVEKTHEACSHNKLTIKGKSGNVVVLYAANSPVVRVPSPSVVWWCGDENERTGCRSDGPFFTTHVFVRRSDSRRFTVYCLGKTEQLGRPSRPT